ncbi:MAG: DUF805 domain-containing protein [Pseudomonadota bacterium]
MGMIEATKTCLSKYVTFSGRARRPEYWWFLLFVVLGSILAGVLDLMLFGATETARMSGPGAEGMAMETSGPSPLNAIFSLAMFVPLLAAGWRRMHDTGRPGWWLLMPLGVSLLAGLLGGAFMGFGSMGGPMTGEGPIFGGMGMVMGLLVFLAPLVAYIVLIVWLASPSQPGENDYGPAPPVA